jgi:hypothetical protein
MDLLRRRGERSSEEVGIVGMRGSTAAVVGEVRWRSGPMGRSILREIEHLKVPAMAEAGITVRRPAVVLVSWAGFTDGLREAAAADEHIRLVELDELTDASRSEVNEP